MTKHILYSVCLLSFGIILCLLVIADRRHFWSPSMSVEPQAVDFGDVSAADDVHQEVVVKNTGWSPLVLERVLLSCSSCITIHSFPKKPIPPGRQGNIVFSLGHSKRNGPMETSFVIVSNAKPQQVAVIEVTANIHTDDQ